MNASLQHHAIRRRKQTVRSERRGAWMVRRLVPMKRRRVNLEGSRRPRDIIGRRVGQLRGLLPCAESVELCGLFQEAASYIARLQLQVEMMQLLLKCLSPEDQDCDN